jgi:hypothetical protein
MFGVLAFTAIAAVILVSALALRQQSLNQKPGRHRVGEPVYAAKHRNAGDGCWKPVCGCSRAHKLPPQAIIERLRREEARAGARYGIGGVRLATAI